MKIAQHLQEKSFIEKILARQALSEVEEPSHQNALNSALWRAAQKSHTNYPLKDDFFKPKRVILIPFLKINLTKLFRR